MAGQLVAPTAMASNFLVPNATFFVELAAKHVAVTRGLGYDGVYLGAHMPATTFGEIIDLADGYGDGEWRELARDIRHADCQAIVSWCGARPAFGRRLTSPSPSAGRARGVVRPCRPS